MDRRIVYAFSTVLIGLVILAVSTAPDHPVVKVSDLDSQVLESDELYFKNLRRFYYQIEQRKDAGLDLLRLKDRWRTFGGTPKGPNLAIVMNPLHDQAHVMFQWQDSALTGPMVIRSVDSAKTFTLDLDLADMDQQLQAAVLLYEALHDKGLKIEAEYQGERLSVWNSVDERKQVKTVLRDFFRLIGAL